MKECAFCKRILDPDEEVDGFCEDIEMCGTTMRVNLLKRRVSVLSETLTVAKTTVKIERDTIKDLSNRLIAMGCCVK